MRTSKITKVVCMALALLAATFPPVTLSGARTAAEASEIARQQTGGGRVLAVKPADGGFQVKVLTPDGKVRFVFVPSS